MSVKRFHSRRSYKRMFLWGGICLFLALIGLLAMDMTGSKVLMMIAGVVGLRLIWIAFQGKKNLIEYVLGADALLLRRGAEEERLPLDKVIDANLIDLVTARDYVQQHGSGEGELEQGRVDDPLRSSTRYCGVPIGKGRWGALLDGLSTLSTHSFKQSLVLLRIRDGGVLLLSPRYSERMVAAIGKAKEISS